jgi:hypothetical protein
MTTITKKSKVFKQEKELFCPLCKTSCGRGMGSGFIYMLHHTIGCKAAKRY